MKNKIVAALLAFVGGSIGLHKFYLRDPGAGIFYIFLMFMTSRVFPVSALLGFIDGLRYLMMSSQDFDRKFNQKYYRNRPQRRPENRRRRKKAEYYEMNRGKVRKPAPKVRSNPFKKSGIKKYKEYEIEDAIDDFKKGLKIEPNDIALHFNLACAYSLLENKGEAFKYLENAVALGMSEEEKIMKHDDLAFLRIQPEFEIFKENGFSRPTSSTPHKENKQNVPKDDLLLAQLNRLMELRKKGVLTEQEFLLERKKVIAR